MIRTASPIIVLLLTLLLVACNSYQPGVENEVKFELGLIDELSHKQLTKSQVLAALEPELGEYIGGGGSVFRHFTHTYHSKDGSYEIVIYERLQNKDTNAWAVETVERRPAFVVKN